MQNQKKISGLLLVDKPRDWTSFDVVNKVRFVIAKELGVKPKKMKVGHSGTLDPKATGLLVLAIGDSTKRIEALTKQNKSYEVGSELGSTSTTGDSEGDISINESAQPPNLEQIKVVLNSFIGEIMQKPHKYSAVKVYGQRAYKLARKGKQVELKPRKVQVYSLDKVEYQWPRLNFDVKVSSGTYVRSLVEDIGQSLGVGAYVTSLRRTSIGDYHIEQAISPEDVDYNKVVQALLSLD